MMELKCGLRSELDENVVLREIRKILELSAVPSSQSINWITEREE